MDRFILVDSSALVAYFDRRDQYHRHADRAFRDVARRRVTMLVPEFVVGEVSSYFKRRSFDACRAVVNRAKEMTDSGMLTLVVPEMEEVMDTANVVLELPDPDFTYFDALLVAMARRRGVARIFSFDRVFSTLGFPSV